VAGRVLFIRGHGGRWVASVGNSSGLLGTCLPCCSEPPPGQPCCCPGGCPGGCPGCPPVPPSCPPPASSPPGQPPPLCPPCRPSQSARLLPRRARATTGDRV